MAVKSVLNPEVIVGQRTSNADAAKKFISGGSLLGSSIVSSAANKIVGFQRSSMVRPVMPDINSILNTISSNIINNFNNSIQTITEKVSGDTMMTIENIKNEIFKQINQSIITNKTELINYINKINFENKKEFIEKVNQIINQTTLQDQKLIDSKQELIQYVDNVFNNQDIKNIITNLQNNVKNEIQKIENNIEQIKVNKVNSQSIQQQISPSDNKTSILNIETVVRNIIQSTRDAIDNIQNQTSQFLGKTVNDLSKNYQQRVRQVDDAKPIGILDRFLKAYNTAIGFIQFFNNKKNMDRLRTSLSNLKASFTETFEVAKLVRQVIIKIVKQLSSLPKVSPSGGGGINLDVGIPGPPLKKAAPQTIKKMGMGRMLKYGALGVGSIAAGGAVVNALSDTDSIQPMMQESMIPQTTVDMFSAIVDRFSNAINSLIQQAEYSRKKQPSSTKTGSGSGGSSSFNPGDGGDPGGSMELMPGNAPTEMKTLMDMIASPESGGNYEAMYPSTELKGATEMTISEVAKKATGPVGRYQHKPQFLEERARAVGLDPTTAKFSPQNQDLITRGHITSVLGGDESKIVEQLKRDPESIKRRLEKSTYTGLQKYGSNFNQLFSQRMQKYGQISVSGKPGEPGKPGIEGTPGKAGIDINTLVSPAPQQTQQVARAQSISQPPPQQQAQVNILPMDLSGGSQQAGGGKIIPPPQQPQQGPTVPFLSSGNPENFLVLYSKMVYNIVDG